MARLDIGGNESNIKLQSKDITVTDNGTQTVYPDSGYGALSSVEINTDVDTLQGLDLSEIYGLDFTNSYNNYYARCIEHSQEVNQKIDGGYTSVREYANDNYLKYIKLTNVLGLAGYSFFGSAVEIAIINSLNVKRYSFDGMFASTPLRYIQMNIELYEGFADSFGSCSALQEAYLEKYKNGNLLFNLCPSLQPSSIHYIIQNAVDLTDGATSRTIQLHATVKINWQNSEYYEEDLATLSTKGITIA